MLASLIPQELTPEVAERLTAGASRGELVVRLIHSAEEAEAARLEGWTDNYAALPALTNLYRPV